MSWMWCPCWNCWDSISVGVVGMVPVLMWMWWQCQYCECGVSADGVNLVSGLMMVIITHTVIPHSHITREGCNYTSVIKKTSAVRRACSPNSLKSEAVLWMWCLDVMLSSMESKWVLLLAAKDCALCSRWAGFQTRFVPGSLCQESFSVWVPGSLFLWVL